MEDGEIQEVAWSLPWGQESINMVGSFFPELLLKLEQVLDAIRLRTIKLRHHVSVDETRNCGAEVCAHVAARKHRVVTNQRVPFG